LKSFQAVRTGALVAGLLSLWLQSSQAEAHNGESHTPRPDDHAPIGVMADHTHGAGEVMASYRYMRMRMDGNRDGSRQLSASEVLNDFNVTPLDMDMEMHMFGLMYAPIDQLTLMVMLPYVRLEMDHLTGGGTRFRTNSSGVGDLKMLGLVPLWSSAESNARIHTGLGFSAPTGSIRARDNTPGGKVRLPYPMQVGSGSWSFTPSLTYASRIELLSWGAQASGVIRINENDLDYRLGHRAEATLWTALQWTDWASTGLRLAYSYVGNIQGADPSLEPEVISRADPNRRKGERLDIGGSLNLLVPGNVRLSLEALAPIAQSLDGPQLEVDWNLIVGASYNF